MNKLLQTWLEQTLNAKFTTATIKTGASHRHFYRLRLSDGQRYVAMFSPPKVENNAQFVLLAKIFAKADIPVPKIVAASQETGNFLLEDLGDNHLSKFYDERHQDTAIHQAIDALIKIQQVTDVNIPAYTERRFQDELSLFNDWFLQELFAMESPTEMTEEIWPLLIDNAISQPQCCIHRDYHSQNLILNDQNQLGIVDFQDALMGPVGYDLASLLRDCYHRFSEPDIAKYRHYYLTNKSIDFDDAQFTRWVDLCAVQRQLKAVGIFVRLYFRDNKRNHLKDIQPVIQHIESLASQYQLGSLSRLLNKLTPQLNTRLASL